MHPAWILFFCLSVPLRYSLRVQPTAKLYHHYYRHRLQQRPSQKTSTVQCRPPPPTPPFSSAPLHSIAGSPALNPRDHLSSLSSASSASLTTYRFPSPCCISDNHHPPTRLAAYDRSPCTLNIHQPTHHSQLPPPPPQDDHLYPPNFSPSRPSPLINLHHRPHPLPGYCLARFPGVSSLLQILFTCGLALRCFGGPATFVSFSSQVQIDNPVVVVASPLHCSLRNNHLHTIASHGRSP